MNRYSSFLIIAFLVFISGGLLASEKKFRHITATEGLSYNTVTDIDQDQNGFIWIGTGEGLNRYDGFGFKQFYSDKTASSIPSNEVKSLLVTKKGRLYVGTSEGLCFFNPEYQNFTTVLYDQQSLGNIKDIFETSKGKIIITSELGVYSMSGLAENLIKLPLEKNLFLVQEDSQGNLWSYKRMRLLHFTDTGEVIQAFQVSSDGLSNNIPSIISALKIDSHGRIWVGTQKNGPLLFNQDKNTFEPILLRDKPNGSHPMYFVREITEDRDGKFWIGTEKGLFIYDLASKSYDHYSQSFDPTLTSLNDNAVYKVFQSRENIIWLGTYFGGINIWEPFEPGFKKILPGTKPHELKGKALSQIIDGPDGKLWIATEDAGIALFNPQDQTFSHILNNESPNSSAITNNIHSLAIDSEGQIWSGNFWGGINKINPKTNQITNYSNKANDPNSLGNNTVFALFFDSSNLLWIGTMNGIDCYSQKENRFIHFKTDIFRDNFIYDIFQDNQKNYWFCTYNAGLYRYNKEQDSIFNFQKGTTQNLNSNSFISHCVDSRGKVWFGTRDGGLVKYDPDNKQFSTIDMDKGLPNNDIYGILEDNHKNLWLSSNKGITKFSLETGAHENFTADHGLVGNQFNFKSYHKTKDGTMYFGAVNGLSYFHPDRINIFESKPLIHFTGFKLFNEIVVPGEKSLLAKDIDFTDEITLKYNQNVISFDFTALDYHSGGNVYFSYYMDGFESNWRSAGNQRSTTYTNLHPGHYTFRIKAANVYNYPTELRRSIRITVLPPIWKTVWAYLFYALITVLLGLSLYRYLEIRNKEKMSLKIEKIEKEKLQELHLHKMNFFTFITHEFKTPLTIIVASMDSFFTSQNISNEFRERITMVKRNVLKLQFLINQLMDFRKIETDHETVTLVDGDVIHFLNEVFTTFTALFRKKNLQYKFSSQHEKLIISFDPDKLEKIVSNLLSNAFKYTPEKGCITFRIETYHEDYKPYLALHISDTGIGMSEEQLSQIFDLFYKIEDNQSDYQGSGIGLTLTQSLVSFLNGKIEVKSKLGEGSTFTVKLPAKEGKEQSEFQEIPIGKSIYDDLSLQVRDEDPSSVMADRTSDFEILFVEDNKDLLNFLSHHFGKKYKVRSTPNGLKALQSIRKNVPDLVVTDLMMPQMDGISLCKELKTNFEYSHIPLIMLTAKSGIETRLESLEVGADIYLPKPFLLSELELHIRNILASKANLKQHFIQFGNLSVEHPIKNQDQQFLEKISAIVHANMENPEFGILILTKELGIGRTMIHTKLKQILDLSVTEFVNTIRLREAQKLLAENSELTISEISYKVGFKDPNYFSRMFKKTFSISASDYRNNGPGK